MNQTKKSVVGPKEEAALQRAEKLASAGFNAFGDSDTKFDLEAEMRMNLENGISDPNDPLAHPENAPNPPQAESSEEEQAESGAFQNPYLPKLSDDPEKRLQQVYEMLAKISIRPPSVQQMMGWKQLHGDFFLLTLDEGQVYIFRYIKDQEWKQILANLESKKLTEASLNDHIFERCVLWPKLDHIVQAGLPAGLKGTLVEQIKIRSMFLDPGHVVNFTVKI